LILITGGSGFIGAHTAKRFLDAGHEVLLTRYRVAREPAFLQKYLGSQAQVVDLDLANPLEVFEVFRQNRIEQVIHLASTAWGASPGREFHTNLGGLMNVLEAAHSWGISRFIAVSSVSLYESARLASGPFYENALLNVEVPVAGPAAYKQMEEILALHFGDQTGLDVRVARIAVIYGPLYRTLLNLPSQICYAIAAGRPITRAASSIYGDFCYVKDTAEGLYLLASAQKPASRIFNIGAGRGINQAEMLAVAASLGLQPQNMAEVSAAITWHEHDYMDISRAQSELGYHPKYDLLSGMTDYIAWLQTEKPTG
jgi:nucleoside-diphosphate-sugar epimerase